MNYNEFCSYCGKEYVPRRRGVQKFCSNSCRSRNWQLKRKKKNLLAKTEIIEEKHNNETAEKNKLSAAGIGNTVLGVTAVDLTKYLLTPEPKRNATKEDVRKLYSILKGQRYFPIQNTPNDNFGRKPFYDLETEKIIFMAT